MKVKPKKLFDYEEVNQLTPQLEQKFKQLLFHKKELAKASKQLKQKKVEPILIGEIPIDCLHEVKVLQLAVQEHYQTYKKILFEVEKMGGKITDLELGRVEFPAKIEGRHCQLTWQLGVTQVPYPEFSENSKLPQNQGKKEKRSAQKSNALKDMLKLGRGPLLHF